MSMNPTPLRRQMLTEAANSEPGEHYLALHCVNKKRAIWKPVRMDLDLELKLSAGESRAVMDLWLALLLDTPDWQGDMDVYRTLQVTGAGKALLAEWDSTSTQEGDAMTDPQITEEMIEAATAVINQGHSYLSSRDLATAVVEAALAGRTVIDLPEPDVMCAADWPRWFAHGVEVQSKRMVFAGRDSDHYLSSADARGYAAQLLAAADFADCLDRLASLSSKGGEPRG
jgi:hypothetical protein